MNDVQFRDIAGFPGYRVGTDGSVWSCYARGGHGRIDNMWRELRPARRPTCGGHRTVDLRKGNRPHRVYVHRLVLAAFVGPCPDGMECRHLDGNPSNNRLENLRWGTHKENLKDMASHGTARFLGPRRGAENAQAKLTETDVLAIRRLYATGRLTQRQIGEMFLVATGTIKGVINRRSWRHVD